MGVTRVLLPVALAVGLFTGSVLTAGAHRAPGSIARSCAPGYVDANLSWGEKCLRAGEFCKTGNPEYHAFGFDCPDGHLVEASQAPPTATTTPTALGRTVLLARRTRTAGCMRGALPDQRCSPGAFSAGLTKAVICSSTFRTGAIRNVPQSEKNAVELEYRMPARSYGRAIEIDHIVSLELGGSNAVSNLFPEPGSGRSNYHEKDKLENRLHALVCAGAMTLAAARHGIATNWETLYARVFDVAP